MRWRAHIVSAVALAGMAGCGRHCETRYAYDDEPSGPRVVTLRSHSHDDRPQSLLVGGDGLDMLALNATRSDWPSAFRDYHEGDATTYREVFNDVQGGDPFGGFGFGGAWGNDYVWRQFRSERVGSSSR